MILYIIKSILCSALFIGAYFLLLEKERIHTFKRLYLLLSVILALTIPAISIEVISQPSLIQNLIPQTFGAIEKVNTAISYQTKPEGFGLRLLLVGYGFMVGILLFRLLKNLWSVYKATGSGLSILLRSAKLIVLPTPITPHTFLNYIFISHLDVSNNQILTHELTHSRQRHSLDILFIELIHCIFWINPVLILYKKAIRLNHEFLADESVNENHQNLKDYQKLLLQKIIGSRNASVVSLFNYSMTKKRFTMMTTLRNKQRSTVHIIVAILLLLSISALSANILYGQAPLNDEYTIYKDGEWKNQKLTVIPEPFGGRASLMKSFQQILTYPQSAKTDAIEGEVAVMFEVSTEGKITSCTVVQKLQADCDAIVVTALTKPGISWRPAELKGQKYAARFVLPVKFQIGEGELKETFNRSTVHAKALNTIYLVTSSASN